MNRVCFAAVAALGAVLLAASPSRADDKPRINKLEPESGPPGTNVAVRGVNFPDKNDDVEVTAGGAKCMVLSVAPSEIRFFIPSAPAPPPGALPIVVKIKGHDLSAKFTVLEVKSDKDDLGRRDKERQKYEGGGKYEDPFKQNEEILKITKLEILSGTNPTCIVEGTTTLPKDFFLAVTFGFAGIEDKQIEARKVMVKGNTWKAQFGPYNGQIMLAGRYYVNVLFEMTKQSPIDLKRAGWPDKLSEGERTARELIWKKEIREVGTPEQTKLQEAEIRGHFVELCKKTTDCFESLERAYCAAGKSYHKKPSGSGYDEDEWAKWVQARGVGLTDDDLKKIKNDNRFIRGVHFNAEAWQQWIESDLFKNLLDVFRKHQDVKKRYVGARDERVQVEGDYLISIVVKLAQRYSGEIFEKNKLALPESLRSPKDLSGVGESVAVSRGHFEGHRKLLLERLGLASFDPGAKPEKKEEKK